MFKVDRTNFNPIPKVDSAVVKLTRKNVKHFDYELMSKFLKDAFKYKRKTLRNNLKSYNLKAINEILNKYNYSISNRAEQIPFYIFIEIVCSYNNIR